MRDSLIIVGFFVLGIVFGMNDILPDSLVGNSSVSFGALCCLMFFVGVSVGSDSKIFASIRSVNPRLMLLPLMTIVGTLPARLRLHSCFRATALPTVLLSVRGSAIIHCPAYSSRNIVELSWATVALLAEYLA